jgi:hypothetical protein
MPLRRRGNCDSKSPIPLFKKRILSSPTRFKIFALKQTTRIRFTVMRSSAMRIVFSLMCLSLQASKKDVNCLLWFTFVRFWMFQLSIDEGGYSLGSNLNHDASYLLKLSNFSMIAVTVQYRVRSIPNQLTIAWGIRVSGVI